MELLCFPKFFRELDLAQLARTMRELGFDGVEVLVRDGYWVDFDSVPRTLPGFARAMRDEGLAVNTATTDVRDLDDPRYEPMLAAFAENGIDLYRFGGFPYREPGTFHAACSEARRTLERLEQVVERYGIRAVLQTHGGVLHASATASYFLVRDLDPRRVAIHWDPGNMVVQDGMETWRKGIDALGPYLALIGVKNGGRFLRPDPRRAMQLAWIPEWTTLERGIVDWREVLDELRRAGYQGRYTMHNFYEHSLETLAAQTRADVEYFRAIAAAAGVAG